MEHNTCPTCGQRTDKQKIRFSRSQVKALMEIRKALGPDKTIIRKSELPLKGGAYTMFSTLRTFGFMSRIAGMKAGEYVINKHYVNEFLDGKVPTYAYYISNPVTGLVEYPDETIYIGQVPKVQWIIDEYGEKMTEYLPNKI